MSVACGIVGLPNVGKTTLFNAISASQAETAAFAFSSLEVNQAVVPVPDDRLETIRGFIETKKLIPATVKLVDIPGIAAGASKGEGVGNKFLGAVKETDAILHVVRCFESGEVARDGGLDPITDIELLELELAMADLDTVTRNIDRVAKKARTGDKDAIFEQELFKRAKEVLEDGAQLRQREWKREELAALKPLFLLTLKPVLFLANVGDDDLAGEGEYAKKVGEYAANSGCACLALCADIECELRNMEPEDQEVFMADLGIEELSLGRLIRAAYDLLGLQTFFTAGPKEIRAWTIHKGDKGPQAAGVIHSDFEKAFIRAEVYSVDDLVEHRTESAIRSAGKLRTEGRDYVMREGDISHFLVGK